MPESRNYKYFHSFLAIFMAVHFCVLCKTQSICYHIIISKCFFHHYRWPEPRTDFRHSFSLLFHFIFFPDSHSVFGKYEERQREREKDGIRTLRSLHLLRCYLHSDLFVYQSLISLKCALSCDIHDKFTKK